MLKLKLSINKGRGGWLRLSALLLILCALIPSLCSCGFLFPTDDVPQEIFDPSYLENYYVNKHTPIAHSGAMKVFKYESSSSKTFTLGGRDYHGGIVFGNTAGALGYADIEFPLGGQYQNISFVLSGNGAEKNTSGVAEGKAVYASGSYALEGAYPTLRGTASDLQVGIQILIDGRLEEEIILSSHDVARRYTYGVSAAESFEVKVIAGDSFDIYMMEITVWEGEAHPTGYVSAPAGDEPVKLVRDLKPYMIPSGSEVGYYPNAASDEVKSVVMNGVEFEDAFSAQVSMALIGSENSSIYFDLEGKYGYLTFAAGAVDGAALAEDGSAWLSVYADGKKILEEVISNGDLYHRFTVEVTGCRQLRFEFKNKDGNENLVEGSGCFYGVGDAYAATTREALDRILYANGEHFGRPVRVIGELGVLSVTSMATRPVYNGAENGRTFTMGGERFGEGVVLYAQNSMLAMKPASAAFNLNGRFDTISFYAGHVSGVGAYENDEIEIYADGKLIETISVACRTVPRKYTVEVAGCRRLEFVAGKLTNSFDERPALGIANIVAYPSGVVPNGLFPERNPSDYEKTCDLIDTFGFFEVYNSRLGELTGPVSVKNGYFDGKSDKPAFSVGDRTLNKGLLLKTNVYSERDIAGIYSGSALGTALGDWGLPLLSFAGPSEVHESAAAMANIRNSGYTSVTFTVAMQASYSADPTVRGKTSLMIGADGVCAAEIVLTENMKPATYTVELGSDCDRLLFWLDCSQKDGGSHVYAIYDIVLNK